MRREILTILSSEGLQSGSAGSYFPAPCRGVRSRGIFSFLGKRISPFDPQEKGIFITSKQLEEVRRLPIALPARGEAAFRAARRFDLLLLSAVALESERKCGIITFYRKYKYRGERSKAALAGSSKLK